MPGFDCVVPMIDSNVPVFLILSLTLLKIYFSAGKEQSPYSRKFSTEQAKFNLLEVMAVRYFRAIDGLGRIVLPAELLHRLNWEKGKMSVSIEEKDGCLIVSSVPAAGRPPAPPSPVKFQDSPDGQSKIISLPVSKK